MFPHSVVKITEIKLSHKAHNETDDNADNNDDDDEKKKQEASGGIDRKSKTR